MKSPTAATQRRTATQKLVCYAVQEKEFCVALSEVRSLTRAHQLMPASVYQTDGMPPPLGWITLQQEPVPVYDLAARLQLAPLPDAAAAREGFLIALKTTPTLALRVDRIMGSVELPNAQLLALPPIATAGTEALFQGIAEVNEKWVLCANAQRLHPAPAARSQSTITDLTTVAPSFSVTAQIAGAQRKAAPQVLLFSVPSAAETSLVFGLSLAQVQEVTAPLPILPVPYAPPYVLGITNWRGVPVPIVDLEMRLGLTTTPTAPAALLAQSRLLVACGPEQRGLLGVLVQSQVKTLRLPIAYTTLTQPLTLLPEFIKGAFAWEEKPLVIPDVDAILLSHFPARQA